MEQNRNAYKVLLGKVEEQTAQGRPRCGWSDDIKTGYIWLRIEKSVELF
jgi:hypothetical protein